MLILHHPGWIADQVFEVFGLPDVDYSTSRSGHPESTSTLLL